MPMNIQAIANVPDALLVPQRAISELQGNSRVFVVADDGTVKIRAVELGQQVGRMMLVRSGLKAGELVAIEGLLSLKEGATIKPKLVDFDEKTATNSGTED
jgi:membrane fusion protein (multidrug efflux system)